MTISYGVQLVGDAAPPLLGAVMTTTASAPEHAWSWVQHSSFKQPSRPDLACSKLCSHLLEAPLTASVRPASKGTASPGSLCDRGLGAVIATMKKPEDNVKMLKLAYTGEQQGASDDNDEAKQQQNSNPGESHSSIRDHTGSGVERKVDGSTDMSDSMFQVGYLTIMQTWLSTAGWLTMRSCECKAGMLGPLCALPASQQGLMVYIRPGPVGVVVQHLSCTHEEMSQAPTPGCAIRHR